jgi:hypothetical protein
MAIKFFCKCGKHLKARDEMAGRRSMCPRCGSPVGIPSLTTTHSGAPLGPMSLQDRLRFWRNRLPSEALPKSLLPEEQGEGVDRDVPESAPEESAATPEAVSEHGRSARREKPPASFDGPLDRRLVNEVLAQRKRRRLESSRDWRLETHWYQCLLYPFRAWPLVFGLATGLALCTAVLAVVLSREERLANAPGWVLWLHGLWGVIPLIILSYLFGFLDCVMASGIAGEYRHVRWPGRRIELALKSCVTWLFCFLAGPIVPLALAYVFWLQAGDLEVIDRLILAELIVVAFGYWILVLLTVNARDGIVNVNPLRVVEQVEQLGWRSIGVAGAGGFLILIHGLLAFAALADLHHDESRGWFALILCTVSGMFWITFVFRLLGVWCYHFDAPLAAGLAQAKSAKR